MISKGSFSKYSYFKSDPRKLRKIDFLASNGWLESFRKRYLIDFKNLHVEAESADTVSASQYVSKLPEMCRVYRSEDIFNADETPLFYKALPKILS